MPFTPEEGLKTSCWLYGEVSRVRYAKFVPKIGSQMASHSSGKNRFLFYLVNVISFQDLSKSAFISLYGALVRPHLEYGMPACSPNRVQD